MQEYGAIIGILLIVAFVGFIQYRSKKAKTRSGSGGGRNKPTGSGHGFKDD